MSRSLQHSFRLFALACAIALSAPFALAQKQGNAPADPMQVTLTRAKIVIDNGKEVSQDAAIARPGDILEEVATYKNVSKAKLTNVVATLPVPPYSELVVSSLKPASAKASVDGKTFSDLPLKRKIRQPNGVEVERAVPLSEYRFLRWNAGDIDAGKSLAFSARFKLSDTSVATASAQNKK
jgi:hypothetical protein